MLAMAAMKPVLYSAAISSCSYRVRIALSLKGNQKQSHHPSRERPSCSLKMKISLGISD